MKFGELVSYAKEHGKKDVQLLVVMPTFASYENVQRHLALLQKQSFLDFNVLLVLGVPFDDMRLQKELAGKKYPFGIIIAKENERRGCSGGFFTGQKYALENWYEYVIMADDDCMPVDEKLVENLYANRERGYVTCRVHFVVDGYRKAAHVSGPTQYSLYSVGIFKKYGLYYLPLFHGADDGEYMERVKEKSFQIENYCEHPYIAGMRLFALFDRSWLFMLQALVIIKDARALFYNLAQLALLLCISLFFLPAYGRRLFAVMTRLLLTHTYGKKAFESIKTGYAKSIVDESSSLLKGAFVVDEKQAGYIDMGAGAKVAGMLKETLCAWRKNIVVRNTYSFFKVFFLCVLARKVHVRLEGKKYLLLGSNENALVHALKMPLFALFLPVYMLLLFALFIPVKLLRQPKTLGYGLE